MDAAVALVEAYLRLNAYLTVTEFQVLQPAPGTDGTFETATDLDILAIRHPWAAETIVRGLGDTPGDRSEVVLAPDPALKVTGTTPDILIGEVKEGTGELNRPLRTPKVLYVALRRMGCCPDAHIREVAARLASHGEVTVDHPAAVPCRVRLVSFCGHVDEAHGPRVLTIPLEHVLRFIMGHLAEYRPILRSAQFRDPVLGLLKLMDKLQVRLVLDREHRERRLGEEAR